MPELIVSVVRVIDDGFPVDVACELSDVQGRIHLFEDKLPVFCSAGSVPLRLPVLGYIRCRIVAELVGADGAVQLRVSTAEPDHVESLAGDVEFLVVPSQLRLVSDSDLV
jgi:hypothetical protein